MPPSRIHLERALAYAAPLVESRLASWAGSVPLRLPFRSVSVAIVVRPYSSNASIVAVDADYAVRFGLLGALADVVFLRAALKLILRLRLRALDAAMCDASADCP